MRSHIDFDRYHIGESLVTSVRHCLRFIGADEKVADHGFVRKVCICCLTAFKLSDPASSLEQQLNSTRRKRKHVRRLLLSARNIIQ